MQFGSEGPLVLQRSLSDVRQNLIHARENDALYEGVRRKLGSPLGSGPALYLYWQPRALPPLVEIVAVARLEDRTIDIEAEVTVEGGKLRTVDDLTVPTAEPSPWPQSLPPTTAAAVLLVDAAASDYLSFAALSEDLEGAMEGAYGGIFGELRHVSSLERLMFAWTGYRDGLPEWVLGVWADPVALDGLVDELQVGQREERDRIILEAAIEAYREQVDGTASPTLEELTASGVLVPELHDLFDRYPIVEGIVLPAGVDVAEVEEAIRIYREQLGETTPPTLHS